MDSRAIRTRYPARVVVAAVLIGLFLVGFIFVAIWQSGTALERARMPGRVVAKEFVPRPEHQITVGRKGTLRDGQSEGDYILTVEVNGEGGVKKPYNVWVDQNRYNAVKIGDSFDVGPYLIHE
jgi:hypothetical protein